MTPTREIWRAVPGYEGYYEVSNLGQVRSLPRRVIRSDGRPRTIPGRPLQLAVRHDRHAVMLWRDGGYLHRRIAVLVLEAFVGPRPAKYHACHNDGDSMNDALTNLRWDTASENMYDRVRHGTHHHASKARCPWGHLLTAPNLVASKDSQGFRGCRACNTARSARRRARKQGVLFDMQYESDLNYGRIMQLAH